MGASPIPRRRNLFRLAVLVASAGALACEPGDPSASTRKPDTRLTATSGGGPGGVEVSSSTKPDVGTVTLRRLNRTEYDNTVRDLLGDRSRPALDFPADNGAEGFTNNADALTMSPLYVERVEDASRRLAKSALANPEVVDCAPHAPESLACAVEVLGRLARRAFRRPAQPAELARLTGLVENTQAEGRSYEESLEIAITSILLSPNFLFRVETDPVPDDPSPHALTDYELASRLSYFLWSSMPDDTLFAYAEAGRLSSPRVFEAQVERMLDDPKAASLVDNFATDWLLHTMAETSPDTATFPEFDAELGKAMTDETKAFLGSFLLGDQGLDGLFDAKYTFMNERLARHYGVPGPVGADLVRVKVDPKSHRGGLLTQASILTMTSIATRTSPVRRGEWVLSELLCTPPPPPPPDVPALAEKVSAGTVRQRMEEHRKNPVCASCHSQMDPIGFSLENFDALGRWRTHDDGVPIDATGTLPDGTAIDGPVDLSNAIKKDPRFADCVTKKLYSYALGRSPRGYDAERLTALSRAFVAGKFKTRDLIRNIVRSDAFRMRRGGNQP
jgi:hypothetical protein